MQNLSLVKLWNDSVATEDRPFVARDYCYASELGKPLIDRYLSMKGIIPTNPPNDRARRKFFAGNVYEFIAGLVLFQLGIVQDRQQTIEVNDGAVKVRGRLDYLIAGKPNYGKARDYISKIPFDKELIDRFQKVINNFEMTYGDTEFSEMVHEIKSCSHFVIEMVQEGGTVKGHELQAYHYCKGLNLPLGVIDYISKDDCLMAEVLVNNPDTFLEGQYYGDLSELDFYLTKNETPPPAPMIVWEKKFKKNFGVEYSSYLKLIYKYDTPQDYADAYKGKITAWNRVLKRIKQVNDGETTPTGKTIELTAKNKISITDMELEGWKPFELAKQLTEIDEDDE